MAGDPTRRMHACGEGPVGMYVCLEEEHEVCHTETFRHVPRSEFRKPTLNQQYFETFRRALPKEPSAARVKVFQ